MTDTKAALDHPAPARRVAPEPGRAAPAVPPKTGETPLMDDPCYPDAWLQGPGDDFLYGAEPGPDLDPRADAPAPPPEAFDPGFGLPLDDEARVFEVDLGIDPLA